MAIKSLNLNKQKIRKEGKRLVKRSWKKTTAISVVVFLLLFGIGVGSYYGFRPTNYEKIRNVTYIVDGSSTERKNQLNSYIENSVKDKNNDTNNTKWLLFVNNVSNKTPWWGKEDIHENADGNFGKYLKGTKRKLPTVVLSADDVKDVTDARDASFTEQRINSGIKNAGDYGYQLKSSKGAEDLKSKESITKDKNNKAEPTYSFYNKGSDSGKAWKNEGAKAESVALNSTFFAWFIGDKIAFWTNGYDASHMKQVWFENAESILQAWL